MPPRKQGVTIRVDVGTPARLPEDCPACGWADLWSVAALLLGSSGVRTLGVHTWCRRCGHRLPARES